jgi:hypothetical protein
MGSLTMPIEINLEQVLAEVQSAFASYESALMQNDILKLDQFFWNSEMVVRFGVAENLYGIEAVRVFRHSRETGLLKRSLFNTKITTFGTSFATTTTEFKRIDEIEGRQSQTWVKLPQGWRIVSAHISLLK